jgi:signal peptidase II
MTARLQNALLVLIASTTIACDQATKHVARERLLGGPRRSYLADTIRLEYVENAGAFLGLGAGLPAWARRALFMAGTAVLLAAMVALGLSGTGTSAQRLAIGLVWAGGLSNLADRLLQGNVSDFLNVGVGWLRTGIFNVADMAIMLGAILLAGERVWNHRRRERCIGRGIEDDD